MPSATLSFALTGPTPLAASVALTYRGFSNAGRVELTGAQTYEIDLAMMPAAGLKGLCVQIDTVDAANNTVTASITLTWTSNGTEKSEELSPGGFLALGSPSPTNGITALSITSTANAVIHVTALG